MRDRVVTTHIHDNHGDKDEHLLPFEGTIDWDAAFAAFASAPDRCRWFSNSRRSGRANPSLDQIREACDKIEQKFETRNRAFARRIRNGTCHNDSQRLSNGKNP